MHYVLSGMKKYITEKCGRGFQLLKQYFQPGLGNTITQCLYFLDGETFIISYQSKEKLDYYLTFLHQSTKQTQKCDASLISKEWEEKHLHIDFSSEITGTHLCLQIISLVPWVNSPEQISALKTSWGVGGLLDTFSVKAPKVCLPQSSFPSCFLFVPAQQSH